MREYANFIHALPTRTASKSASNFRSYIYLFSVRFMRGGEESKELSCSVFGLGLRLNGQMAAFQETLYACLPSPSARLRREEK